MQRSRTEFDSTVLAGLGGVLVDTADACFADRQRAARRIEIRHEEGDLFGRTQSGEESELVVVPLSLAPMLMDGGDDRLGVQKGRWSRGLAFGFERS